MCKKFGLDFVSIIAGLVFSVTCVTQAQDLIQISDTQTWSTFTQGGFDPGDTLQILSGGNLIVTQRCALDNDRHLIVEPGGLFTMTARLDMNSRGQITMNGGEFHNNVDFKLPDSKGDQEVNIWLHGGLMVCEKIEMQWNRGATVHLGGGVLRVGNTSSARYDPASTENWAIVPIAPYEDITIIDIGDGWKEVTAARPGKVTEFWPADEATDVERDVVLSWTAGVFAVSHDVYFSDSFDDVNTATPESDVFKGNQMETTYTPGRLAFDKTYYWRVDEINNDDTNSPWVGNVCSFTTELYSNIVPVDVNKVTASSHNELYTPDMTVNGSGLIGMEHSSALKDMWLSDDADNSPWLMYEFAKVENLDKMLFWNANQQFERLFGLGIKDVAILYSVDGVNWTMLAESQQLEQGPGQSGYMPQVIDFGLVPAKFVKLNILSKWGDPAQPGYCVSEVQFYSTPVYARNPVPDTGATDIDPRSIIKWRAGREVAQHLLYVSDDQNAVADGTAASVSIPYPTNLAEFDFQLGTTYYWRVDEVNEAEIPSVWEGPVWNLTTLPYLTVDDFESYNDAWDHVVYRTWIDGYGWEDSEGNGVEGNGTGSAVGYLPPQIMETTIKYDGNQSMPLEYGIEGKTLSTTRAVLPEILPVNKHGIKTLSLPFHGAVDNVPGQLFVEINGKKVSDYPGSQEDMKQAEWHLWTIDVADLAAAGITSMETMTIGISGGSGTIYIDAIRLNPAAE